MIESFDSDVRLFGYHILYELLPRVDIDSNVLDVAIVRILYHVGRKVSISYPCREIIKELDQRNELPLEAARYCRTLLENESFQSQGLNLALCMPQLIGYYPDLIELILAGLENLDELDCQLAAEVLSEVTEKSFRIYPTKKDHGKPVFMPVCQIRDVKPPQSQIELRCGFTSGTHGDILGNIDRIRSDFHDEMLGFMPPCIRVVYCANELEPNQYEIWVQDNIAGQSVVYRDQLCVLLPPDSDAQFAELRGVACIEPAFGLDAVWIKKEHQNETKYMGFPIVDAGTVIRTHLLEVIKKHRASLFNRGEMARWLLHSSNKPPGLFAHLAKQENFFDHVHSACISLLKSACPLCNKEILLEALAAWFWEKPLIEFPEYLNGFLVNETDSSNIKSSYNLLEIEVGYGLIPIVDEKDDGGLLKRIKKIRYRLQQETGIIVPTIHIRDNLKLAPKQLRLIINCVSTSLLDINNLPNTPKDVCSFAVLDDIERFLNSTIRSNLWRIIRWEAVGDLVIAYKKKQRIAGKSDTVNVDITELWLLLRALLKCSFRPIGINQLIKFLSSQPRMHLDEIVTAFEAKERGVA